MPPYLTRILRFSPSSQQMMALQGTSAIGLVTQTLLELQARGEAANLSTPNIGMLLDVFFMEYAPNVLALGKITSAP